MSEPPPVFELWLLLGALAYKAPFGFGVYVRL